MHELFQVYYITIASFTVINFLESFFLSFISKRILLLKKFFKKNLQYENQTNELFFTLLLLLLHSKEKEKESFQN